jgi:hypothetical protein
MKTTPLLSLMIAITLTAASAASVAVAAAETPISFLGSAAPESAAVSRVIVITDANRYVNVTGGETVRFVVGDKSFAWSFETGSANIIPFDLSRIAPAGLLNHKVTAYVAYNPIYWGN